MARELNMDTQRQNFWKESIEKEANIRLEWYSKFSREIGGTNVKSSRPTEKHPKPLTLPPVKQQRKPDLVKKEKKKFEPRPKPQNAKEREHQRDIESLLVEMKPASKETKSLLYKGISALGEGRYAYLKARKLEEPEDKYQYPITSGLEYGWKIRDNMKCFGAKSSEFGRTRIVKDSFYRTNGVLPQDELSITIKAV